MNDCPRLPHEWQPWRLPMRLTASLWCAFAKRCPLAGTGSAAKAPGRRRWLGSTDRNLPPSALNTATPVTVEKRISARFNWRSLLGERNAARDTTEREAAALAVKTAPAPRRELRNGAGVEQVNLRGLKKNLWRPESVAGNTTMPANELRATADVSLPPSFSRSIFMLRDNTREFLRFRALALFIALCTLY